MGYPYPNICLCAFGGALKLKPETTNLKALFRVYRNRKPLSGFLHPELDASLEGLLGFGVPYFKTFFVKGTLMK